jgi:DNA-binding GntR family transcriptional regulator
VNTLDEMRTRHLLTPDQHAEIRAWVASGRTPAAILAMPSHLWRALSLASVLMNVDADLTREPALDGGLAPG